MGNLLLHFPSIRLAGSNSAMAIHQLIANLFPALPTKC
jgi:hypothetical protein